MKGDLGKWSKRGMCVDGTPKCDIKMVRDCHIVYVSTAAQSSGQLVGYAEHQGSLTESRCR